MGNLRWIRYRIFDWMRETWSRLLGYRLAQWIDSRHPEWCWAEICVCLGLGYDVKRWRKKSRDSGTCKQDCAEMGSCWCGKMMTPEFRAEIMQHQDDCSDVFETETKARG